MGRVRPRNPLNTVVITKTNKGATSVRVVGQGRAVIKQEGNRELWSVVLYSKSGACVLHDFCEGGLLGAIAAAVDHIHTHHKETAGRKNPPAVITTVV
jgi:hypothetical protein